MQGVVGVHPHHVEAPTDQERAHVAVLDLNLIQFGATSERAAEPADHVLLDLEDVDALDGALSRHAQGDVAEAEAGGPDDAVGGPDWHVATLDLAGDEAHPHRAVDEEGRVARHPMDLLSEQVTFLERRSSASQRPAW